MKTAPPVLLADSIISQGGKNGSLSEIKQETIPPQCGGFSLMSPLLGRQFSSTLVFPNRYTRHSPVRHTVETQMADTALLTHRQASIPAVLPPSAHLPRELQVHPCFPEHTLAGVKERDPTIPAAVAVCSHRRLTLSPSSCSSSQDFLSVAKTRLLKLQICVPSTPRIPSSTPDASIGTFSCTCLTLSLSIHYRSARVTQAVEHSPVLWVLHMMFLHHSLQVD